MIPSTGRANLEFGGLKVYHSCGSVSDQLWSLYHTAEAFIGGLTPYPALPIMGTNTPSYQERQNKAFIEKTFEIELQKRPITEVAVDESFIKSGDLFVILRLDGRDSLIAAGTGSMAGHCATALWIDGELYVLES